MGPSVPSRRPITSKGGHIKNQKKKQESFTPPSKYRFVKVTNTEIELVREGVRTGVSVVSYPWGFYLLADGVKYGQKSGDGYESADDAKTAAQVLDERMVFEQELADAAPPEFLEEYFRNLRERFDIPDLYVTLPSSGELYKMSRRGHENMKITRENARKAGWPE